MKPLSKKRRSFSLGFLFLIFIISIPFLLAYSSGYRLDWENLTFEKTGGFFIHSDLSDTRLFVDEEFAESGGLLLRNILVQNLKSNQSYQIRVEKDGYLPWYKELNVYPNIVTEARILMLPIEIPFKKIEQFTETETLDKDQKSTTTRTLNKEYEDTLAIFTSTTTPDRNLVVFKEEIIVSTSSATSTKTTSTKPATSSKIIIPDYLNKLNIKDIENKKQLRESGKMIAWLESGDIQVYWTGEVKATPFFFCNIRDCKNNIKVSLNTDISQFDFYPNRDDAFIVATQNHIFAVEADDRSRQNLQTIFKGEKPEFKLRGNTIFIKDGQELYRAEI